MSEAETVVESTYEPPKKPKRKYTRRARPKRAAEPPAPPPKKNPIFDGITESDCPFACTLPRCVITEMNCCAHPFKGGLQPMLTVGDGAEGRVRRFNEAKRILAGKKLDLTGY